VVFQAPHLKRKLFTNGKSSHQNDNSTLTPVCIREGPLSYSYLFDSLYLHFGRADTHGSEHKISGISFPAEVGY